MGLFDKLKQMVGVTGIKVNLILPQNTYRQGETISGIVKVTGGPEAKQANKLSVALVEVYPEITVQTVSAPTSAQPAGVLQSQPTSPPEQIHSEKLTSRTASRYTVILAQQFQIPAGAALEYPISFELPAEAAINGPCQEWRLKTELDIAEAFDAADTDCITVIPNDSTQSLRELICKGAGFPTNGLLRIEAVGPSGIVCPNESIICEAGGKGALYAGD